MTLEPARGAVRAQRSSHRHATPGTGNDLRDDRSGLTGVVCETHPDAGLRAFGLWPVAMASTTSSDALPCALIARACARGQTVQPADGRTARVDAWMDLPLAWSGLRGLGDVRERRPEASRVGSPRRGLST